ncbi:MULTISPECIES: flagellar motor protein MotB [unclassified Paenibacillus]|uniref:flagellar motor protein MotB n=1 Tax=unclassified Paenibacillus TaxID=185978 RepID=UPI001AE61DEC|nr:MULTISPECIES: flagellar motor protein MotB [unclassified Paenibacillus]MBP1157766.1 chemotaxis protein MotB [Paenibacillus sp. PvP091]MBP1171498.1 chemotaxis protein MotB [Paenibacillus sp. PvR098]MBP2442526.1 chemotaxis protein MotB [Paenibacillus sp. PvP052]
MARRNKRKVYAPHENHERWLITYADLITLLLIFFVVMYAMSKIDVQKYEVLSQSLKSEFLKPDSIMQQGEGIMGGTNPTKGDETKTEPQGQEEQQLENLLEQIQAYIKQNQLQAQVSAANTPRGVAITLNDLFLFDLGNAELKPDAFPILNQLATLFPSLDATISIEGHTDNLPLATGSVFRDNWGLSQARSLSVLRYFVSTAQFDQRKFISTSFADTRPVAENNTPENRSKNRRVEIVVLRESSNP